MPYYRCHIIDETGKKTTLVKEAASERELASSFTGSNHTLIHCTAVDDAASLQFKRNFNHEVILEFTEIMASLLNSGITIQDSIELCVSIAAHLKTASLARNILRALRDGLSLYEALRMHTPSFSLLYCSLVRLGEQTGSVASVFNRMKVYLRTEKKIRGKVGNVLWYPALVLGTAVAGGIGILVFIMPRMTEIFSAFNTGSSEEIGAEINRIYFSIGVSVTLCIVTVALVVLTFILRKTSERFRYFTDYLLLRLPLAGRYIKSIQTLNFSFAMEMLTGAGITVHTALGECAEAVSNAAYAKALREVHSGLLEGKTLSQLFGIYRQFPPYISTWIAVGERTGAVQGVFGNIREYYQDDADSMSERLMGMLEPCLILLVGLIITGMILQFVVPLFSMYGRLL